MESRKKQDNNGADQKTIEIKIALSPLPSPPASAIKVYKKAQRMLSRIPRNAYLVSGAAVTVIVVGFISYQLLSTYVPPSDKVAVDTRVKGAQHQLQRGTPDYPTILPEGKNISDLGGWTRVSPPDRNPVFAYSDKINNTPVNVSQQPLPDELKDATAEQLNLMAQGYNANEKITVGPTAVYIGTSAKGPQSVIFTKNELLVLIKSTARIDNNHWARYVNSLR